MSARLLPDDFKPPPEDNRVTRRCDDALPDPGHGASLPCSRPHGHDTAFVEGEAVYHLAAFKVDGTGPTRYVAW